MTEPLRDRQRFPARALWLLLGVALGWGLNWPIMKFTAQGFPPLSFRGFAILGAAVAMFAILAFLGRDWRVPRGAWGRMWAAALTNITGWNVLAILGVLQLPSGRAAILGYTMPVWSILLSHFILRERLSLRHGLSLVLGMAAMALLLVSELQTLQAAPRGALLMLAAAFSWALGVVILKRFPVPMQVAPLTAWMFVLGCLPIIAVALVVEADALRMPATAVALGIVYNVFIALLFCYWGWNKLVHMVPVSVSSLSSLLAPVIGVFSGMVILGEQPRWQEFVALGLVLGALALIHFGGVLHRVLRR